MKIEALWTRVGNWDCRISAEFADSDVKTLAKRSVALGFAALLGSEAAGGKVANFKALSSDDIKARFAASGMKDKIVAYTIESVEPWTPASPTGDPVERLERAIKSGALSAEQIAKIRELL